VFAAVIAIGFGRGLGGLPVVRCGTAIGRLGVVVVPGTVLSRAWGHVAEVDGDVDDPEVLEVVDGGEQTRKCRVTQGAVHVDGGTGSP
jgi:hypothetical protein